MSKRMLSSFQRSGKTPIFLPRWNPIIALFTSLSIKGIYNSLSSYVLQYIIYLEDYITLYNLLTMSYWENENEQ